jgi:hypothetical protein
MPTITVRLSQKQKEELLKSGKTLSESVRAGIELYLADKKRRKVLAKIRQMQNKNPIRTTIEQEVQLIKDDRIR